MQNVLAKDVMSAPLVFVHPDSPLRDIADTMVKRSVGSVLVFDGELYQGIITKKDVVRAVAMGGTLIAKELMSRPLKRVDAHATIGDVMQALSKQRERRLVVFSGGRPVGIISDRDIVRVAPDIRQIIAEYAKIKQ